MKSSFYYYNGFTKFAYIYWWIIIVNLISIIMNKESDILKLEEAGALNRLAKSASQAAIRVSEALDLSVQYVQGNRIIERKPNGEIKVIKTIDRIKVPTELKKGAKLCLK